MAGIDGNCDKCRKFISTFCNGYRDTCAKILLDKIEAQQQEIERLREACIKGFSYLSLLFHRADIRNWNTVGMCSVRDVKNVLSELENAYNATKQSVSEDNKTTLKVQNIADFIIENEDCIRLALDTQDREYLEKIIRKGQGHG